MQSPDSEREVSACQRRLKRALKFGRGGHNCSQLMRVLVRRRTSDGQTQMAACAKRSRELSYRAGDGDARGLGLAAPTPTTRRVSKIGLPRAPIGSLQATRVPVPTVAGLLHRQVRGEERKNRMKQLGLLVDGGDHRKSLVRKTRTPTKCGTRHDNLEPQEWTFDGNISSAIG